MEEPYNDLPTSHLIGSVPAVISEEKKATAYAAPEANVQISPRQPGGDRVQGYQKIASSSGGGGPPPADNWQGVFNISSYAQYFNVDTDDVLNRLLSSLDPLRGDFFSRIDTNPDLYGLVWVSTTLVFVIASLGNLASYFGHSASWSFNVGYFLLVIPVEFLRWMIILIACGVSACFVTSNLRSYVEGNSLMLVLAAASVLQFALGLFIKVWFFA
uniref:Protein YIP n=1 Tax=Opuntia streptacantha TaxID=393608 RepID=A0A7C9DSW5_OPUST